MRKIISGVLCAAVAFCAAIGLAGCGDGEYPVQIANLKIDKEPKSIVVLDPCSADVISYMSYDVKIVGRSTEVDQKYLSVAPTMGTAARPNVNAIIESGAEVVFADETLNDDDETALEEAGIAVVSMSVAETPKQLEINYHTVGKILGGNITGDEKAADSYKKLTDSMSNMKDKATMSGTGPLSTVCYLYNDNGGLRLMTSGTYGDMLLGYTGSVNVAVNIDENSVDVNTLKVANPNFIFYADDETLRTVQGDPVLSQLAAVTGGKTLQISKSEISRQGLTALETLQKMIDFIHPELAATPDEAAVSATEAPKSEQATQTATQPATQPATQAATQPATEAAQSSSLAEKYKIDLKDLSLEEEDDNDDVKAMQQRLYDLGYVSDDENITGYYGEISKKAITEFQKNSGIKETGEADNATLVKLFSSEAKKTDKAVDESSDE